MSRRDTIIIASLINIALLAILFTTAIHFDDEEMRDDHDLLAQVTETKETSMSAPSKEMQTLHTTPADAMDQVLKAYTGSTQRKQRRNSQQEEAPQFQLVNVSVKKGDYLEKIARTNGTSVDLIRKINGLDSHRIDIGQVLRVPINTKGMDTKLTTQAQEPRYYTIRNGDNPWKIARKFNVKFEELLRLNNLNEATARSLQVGDKIRVR